MCYMLACAHLDERAAESIYGQVSHAPINLARINFAPINFAPINAHTNQHTRRLYKSRDGGEEVCREVDTKAVGNAGGVGVIAVDLNLDLALGEASAFDDCSAGIEVGVHHVLVVFKVEHEGVGADADSEGLNLGVAIGGEDHRAGGGLGDFLTTAVEEFAGPRDARHHGFGLAWDGDFGIAETCRGFGAGGNCAAEAVGDELCAKANADDGELGVVGLFDECGLRLHPGERGDIGDVLWPAKDDDTLHVVKVGGDAGVGFGGWKIGAAYGDAKAVVTKGHTKATKATKVGMLESDDWHRRR